MFDKIKAYYKQLLPQLTNEEWQDFENCITIKQLKKGEHLIKEGMISNTVSFINYGFIRMYVVNDGRDISLEFFEENEYVSAYESFLTRNPCKENIEALMDTELLEVSYDDIQMLYIKNPIYQEFGRKVAESLFIDMCKRLDAFQSLSPEQRYTKIIDERISLSQHIPQYMLASYIGITPEHLSRIRRKLLILNN